MKKNKIPLSKVHFYWSIFFMLLALFPIILNLLDIMPTPLALSLMAICIALSSLEISLSTKARLVEYMERLLKIAGEEAK